jgi:hypothetical protein
MARVSERVGREKKAARPSVTTAVAGMTDAIVAGLHDVACALEHVADAIREYGEGGGEEHGQAEAGGHRDA